MELFSGEWAAALERELAADRDYGRIAARWRGSLLFVQEADHRGGERSLFLDLVNGAPRTIRPAGAEDQRAATVAVAAPSEVWRHVLSGRLEPAGALVGGQLRLVRGSMFSLLPHLAAARALLVCAQRIPLPE